MHFYAAEDWTDTTQGTYIKFKTTTIGGTTTSEKMRISDSGNVGIGTTSPVSILTTRAANPLFTFHDTKSLDAAGWLANTEQLGTIEAYKSDV
jgi:hypothetical protein